MASVIMLIIVVLFCSGLVGMHMFAPAFHHQCVNDVTLAFEDASQPRPFEWGCGGARSCPAGSSCLEVVNAHATNVAGFDHAGVAMLSAFQVRIYQLKRYC